MAFAAPWTAFAGTVCLASGDPAEVAAAVKRFDESSGSFDEGSDSSGSLVLVFDAGWNPVELDLRGSQADVVRRVREDGEAVPQETRGPGRPRLGVVAREVTLLPRHWKWLAGRPGGASVALRKLVDEARRAGEGSDRVRLAREATYRFMHAVAGNLPGFEEATRALFAGDRAGFAARLASWPADVRTHATRAAAYAFEAHPL
jgi:hypothetical protein